MAVVTCPFCYRRIDGMRLSFACSGRHAPGYGPCEKAVNRRRRTETGSEELMYPVFPPASKWRSTPRRARCPFCHGWTGEHVCPACQTPLPADFGRRFSPVIALVGARSTGKTVYLIVLAQHLRTVLRDRFRANVWLYPDDARRELDASVEAIFTAGELPEFTEQLDGRSDPLVFQWRRRRGLIFPQYRSSYVSFFDTAGESLGTEAGTEELKFLVNADAFIVVLDPFTLPDARERLGLPQAAPSAAHSALTVLEQVTRVLRKEKGTGEGRLRKPIAVAFSKIDALRGYLGDDHPIFTASARDPWHDDAAGRAVHDSVRELLLSWGASEIDESMQANYANYRYFAVSSLGRPPHYEQRVVAAGGVKPLRVADPLVWLFSQYNLVPRRRDSG